MNNKKIDNRALSFVTIMVIIAIFALLLRVAIEQLMKLNITQNESNAQATLKLISTALENYAKDHLGAFPSELFILTQTNPAYLDKEYVRESSIKGYTYNCPRIEPLGYSCLAIPVKCRLSGKTIYTIVTGGALMSEECGKKE